MSYPANCKYTEDHEWVRVENNNIAYVGITHHAQSELGDLVFIEVETVGKTIDANQVFGTVEAVKTTSELYMPLKSKVLEFNKPLADDPSPINNDPYGEGWIVKVEIENIADLASLMSAEEYKKHIGVS